MQILHANNKNNNNKPSVVMQHDAPIEACKPEEKKQEELGVHRVAPAGRGRPLWQQLAGRLLIVLTLAAVVVPSLLVVAAQACVLLASKLGALGLRLAGRHAQGATRLHEWAVRCNARLLYVASCPSIAVMNVWSRAQLNLSWSGDALERFEGARRALVLPNHSYELDYMANLLLVDRLGCFEQYKSLAKSQLKWLPIAGWSLWLADMVFVERAWQRDRHSLGRQLGRLARLPAASTRLVLGLFAEGTRWTPAKHKQSGDYCRSRALEPLEYHLWPRKRGFQLVVRTLMRPAHEGGPKQASEEPPAEEELQIFNVVMVMRRMLDFGGFLRGAQLEVDAHIERVHVDEATRRQVMDSQGDQGCPLLDELLVGVFRRKDALVREYLRAGRRFAAAERHVADFRARSSRPWAPLAVWALDVALSAALCLYWWPPLGATCTTSNGASYAWLGAAAGGVALGQLCLRAIERESRV